MLDQLWRLLFGRDSGRTDDELSVLIDVLQKGRWWPRTIEPPIRLGGAQNVRYDAATLIADKYGPKAERAVPALVEALDDPDVYARRAVIRALARIGQAAEPATPKLIETLRSDDELLRMDAAYLLKDLKVDATTPSLLGVLNDMDPYDRAETVQWLGIRAEHVSAEVPPLIAALANDDEQRQDELIEELGDGAFDSLVEALGYRDWRTRKNAVTCLARFGSESVPHLVGCLKDDDIAVDAVMSLGVVGERSPQAVAALVDALESSFLRFFAASQIRTLGPRAAAASERLRELCSSRYEASMRAEAARALWAVSGEADEVAQVLCEFVNSDSDVVKYRAVQGLAELSPTIPQVLPALIDALDDFSGDVGQVAAHAIGKMGEAARAAVTALAKSLDATDSRVRLEAAIALWKVDPGQTPVAVDALVELLAPDGQHQECYWDEGFMRCRYGQRSGEERAKAARALGEIGPDAIQAVPALRDAMSDPSTVLQDAAKDSLHRIELDSDEEPSADPEGN